MAFSNLSFETAGAEAGCASGWVFGCHGQHDYAEFGTAPWETFEDWAAGYLFAFVGVPTDLEQGTFATLNPTPKYAEDFEEYWDSNHLYVYALSAAVASFDTTPEDYEDFEEDWVAGYLYSFVGPGTDLTVATYDGGAENFEDFEESWAAGYLYSFVGPGTDLTAMLFDIGVNAYENFEGTWTAMTTI